MAKILVVDDDKVLRDRMKKILDMDGHEVFTAEDGQKCLEAFDKECPEIVLLDIRMAGMSGTEVLSKIKERSKETEVIIISGHGGIETAIDAMKRGAFRFIQKPIEYDELDIEIKKALEKQKMKRMLDEYVLKLESTLKEKTVELSQRKKAEVALKESEEKYRTLIEEIDEGYFEVDLTGKFTFVSDWFLRIAGDSRDDLLKMTHLDYMTPDSAKKIYKAFNELFQTRKPVKNLSYEIITTKGEKRIHELSASLMTDKGGNPIGFRGIVKDVTARAKVEDALMESEERYKILFNHAPLAIVVILDNSVRFYNSEALNFSKYSKEEFEQVVGDNFLELIHPEDRDIMAERYLKRLAGEDLPPPFPIRIIIKNGEIKWAFIYSIIIPWEGKKGLLTYLVDITLQKQAEEERQNLLNQLSQAEKMKAIGIIAGGVAHDLNNILAGAVTYPDLLLLQLPEDSPLRKPIADMRDSGQKAATIVQDLLTLARRGVPTTEVVDLNEIITEYLKSPECAKLRSFHPHVAIETDLSGDLFNISGSEVHLAKTVMNLVSNASEAMEEGGTITISTETRYIHTPLHGYEQIPEGDYVVLSVSDTGVGIPQEDIERIFEPFYTKKKMGRSGTGLGMAVVWGTVKDHKGYIDIESTEGKGTTFTLYFPATKDRRTKDKPYGSPDEYKGRGERILVVDDIKEQRDIAATILSELGYSASTVSSGEEAITYLKEHRADLLVLDMIMDPGIDGLDTYHKILELHPNQKAIIASGFSETERVKEAQRLGAGKYIRKPYTMEKIGMAVREELER